MEIIKENALSIIILKSLEWPDHKYFELIEIHKKFFGNPVNEMYYRLSQLCEIFRELSAYAKNSNLFLVKFSIVLPKIELIPESIRRYYFDFFLIYKDLEYKNGIELSERLEAIIYILFTLLQKYESYDPAIKLTFPISESMYRQSITHNK